MDEEESIIYEEDDEDPSDRLCQRWEQDMDELQTEDWEHHLSGYDFDEYYEYEELEEQEEQEEQDYDEEDLEYEEND